MLGQTLSTVIALKAEAGKSWETVPDVLGQFNLCIKIVMEKWGASRGVFKTMSNIYDGAILRK